MISGARYYIIFLPPEVNIVACSLCVSFINASLMFAVVVLKCQKHVLYTFRKHEMQYKNENIV